MLKSKLLWAFILGVATSILLVEAKIHLGYSPWENRIHGVLAAPGTHLATSLNTPGALMSGWQKFWTGLAFTCNLVIYILFWYLCIWISWYTRFRRHPYDHENTLVPPITR